MVTRCFAVAALAASCAVLAGCGGSSHRSSGGSRTSTSASSSRQPFVVGPTDFRANVIHEMLSSQRQLSNVQTDCPHARPSTFPARCRFTAAARGEKVSAKVFKINPKLGRLLSRPHKVAGTITVNGVFSQTHTYVISVTFRPIG